MVSTKVVFNFIVRNAKGELVDSLLHLRPCAISKNSVLKYNLLNTDVIQIPSILERNFKTLINNEIFQIIRKGKKYKGTTIFEATEQTFRAHEG